MTYKEQNIILDVKTESNVNQYKEDRTNAEISVFSSGDLNKYEFLTRKDLKYKPNALDKARFEFYPLGQTFSTGLDKTAQGYQEEGVIKLLKDIRDGLAGGIAPRGPGLDDPKNDDSNNDDYDYDDYIPDYNDDDNNDDRPDYNNIPDLETEEEASERISKNALDKIVKNKENEFSTKLNKLNNDVK